MLKSSDTGAVSAFQNTLVFGNLQSIVSPLYIGGFVFLSVF